jgi:hypothetical protein
MMKYVVIVSICVTRLKVLGMASRSQPCSVVQGVGAWAFNPIPHIIPPIPAHEGVRQTSAAGDPENISGHQA